MKKTLFTAILALAIITASTTIAIAQETTENYEIAINTVTDSIEIEESFKIQGETAQNYETVDLWIPDDAKEIAVLFNNNEPTDYELDGNTYTYNISALNIQKNTTMTVELSYTFSKNIETFEKTLLRDVGSLSITFNDKDNQIFYGENLISGSYVKLKLYTPAEAPLSWNVILLVMLLIVFLIVLSFYSFKNKKPSKIKGSRSESEELLKTKKTLLMSLLKDVEKKHRAKQISDETYNKLKDQYKQEAVDSMKKLEEYESK